MVISRRFFWSVPEFEKFRTVFEDSETVLGVSEEKQHRLFRKDAGRICFDECEALRLCLVLRAEPETEDFLNGRTEAAICV